MKCPNCNGVPYDEVWTCDVCDGKGIVEPLTEQEYLQTCNTEELALVIHKMLDGGLCGLCRWDCRERCIVHKEEDEIKVIVEWLKQPHNGE